jgi:transposase InsO family protein
MNSEGGEVVKGIASGLEVKGEGTVTYMVDCDDGTEVLLTMKAMFVPEIGNRRLISPQGIRTASGNPCVFIVPTHDDIDPHSQPELHIKPKVDNWMRAPPDHVVPLNFSPLINLPQLTACIPATSNHQHEILAAAIDVTAQANANLSDAQKTLLMLHGRLGHVGFRKLQWMVQTGKVKVRNAKNVSTCDPPKCASCLFGKMTKRPTKAIHSTRPKEDREMALKSNDLLPGQRVSVDHYVSSHKGRQYANRGRSISGFCGGALFVDHATGKIAVHHQVSLGAADTIKSKLLFERNAFEDGVVVQAYHTDNGIFSSKEFLGELVSKGQNIRFSGSGAAHQNGVAERGIRTVVGMARTMMLHAALRYGDRVITQDLWPQAMDHAVWLYNRMPRTDTGLSPEEMWTRSTAMNVADVLANCHVWGCPVFVLEPKLRKSGVKIPKWNPRSRQGVNVGFSRLHSSLVALVLNTTTNTITTQFHVVFDDAFTTVPHNGDLNLKAYQDLIMTPRLQEATFENAHLRVTLDPTDSPELDDEWYDADTRALRDLERRRRVVAAYQREPSAIANKPSIAQPPVPPMHTSVQPTPGPSMPVSSSASPVTPSPRKTLLFDLDPVTQPSPSVSQPTPIEIRRSSRDKSAPQRLQLDMGAASKWKSDMVVNIASVIKQGEWSAAETEQLHALLIELDQDEAVYNPIHAMAAVRRGNSRKARNPDSPSVWEALSSDDAESWFEAMRSEMDSLCRRNTWTIVPRSSAGDRDVIPGTWSMLKKRYPDGRFRKYKARWCKRGDIERQKAGPSLNTYSPVVSWATVRMMLLLGLICGLHTTQVDYTNAFAQADLPEPAYMELPFKFERELGEGIEDPIIKLNKSLYGGALAAKHWFDKLSTGLKARGFRQSALDPCLFIRSDMIIVAYVDDCVHWYRDQADMDAFIQSLKDDGDEYNWEHTVEGKVSAFLGIDIQYNKTTNQYKLTQTGLIDKVLRATGLSDCNAKPTPCSADGKPLGTDPNGPIAKEDWSYPSVIGMLLYLAGNSRPDIAFATHQCGRFSHSPKASHEAAIIRICRYLKGTRDQGLILKPGSDLKVDCFVDADFGGLFGVEDPNDPICAKSRTGYVIMLAGCPLVWTSKLQTTIALSTQNAEYVALSQSLRDLVPIREMLLDLAGTLNIGTDIPIVTQSKAFEDNAAALQFALSGKLTPQNKHIATKYHWFRSHIRSDSNPDGWLQIEKVDTCNQAADIFTKNLQHEKFIKARLLLCGW